MAPTRLIPTELPGKVSVADAIGDLPLLTAGTSMDGMDYPMPPQNPFQEWCRLGCIYVTNHTAMNHSDRIVKRFEQIGFGQSESDVPDEHKPRQRGDAKKISGKTFTQNNYRPFPNLPSPTIPASFQSNFIHPFQNRNYTVREGARLQSFPDWYVFCGKRMTMSWEKNLSQYKQVGNAVPPLLAKAIGLVLKDYMENIGNIESERTIRYESTLW